MWEQISDDAIFGDRKLIASPCTSPAAPCLRNQSCAPTVPRSCAGAGSRSGKQSHPRKLTSSVPPLQEVFDLNDPYSGSNPRAVDLCMSAGLSPTPSTRLEGCQSAGGPSSRFEGSASRPDQLVLTDWVIDRSGAPILGNQQTAIRHARFLRCVPLKFFVSSTAGRAFRSVKQEYGRRL